MPRFTLILRKFLPRLRVLRCDTIDDLFFLFFIFIFSFRFLFLLFLTSSFSTLLDLTSFIRLFVALPC